MLDKQNRINVEKDYNYIYKFGKRLSAKYIIVFITKNNFQYNRYGIVTSKKVGNAVKRNRAKRQVRAVIRNHFGFLSSGYDMVIVSRYNISEADFNQIETDFLSVIRRARLQ